MDPASAKPPSGANSAPSRKWLPLVGGIALMLVVAALVPTVYIAVQHRQRTAERAQAVDAAWQRLVTEANRSVDALNPVPPADLLTLEFRKELAESPPRGSTWREFAASILENADREHSVEFLSETRANIWIDPLSDHAIWYEFKWDGAGWKFNGKTDQLLD